MIFLKISQNSQENTCAGVSFLIKLQARSEKRDSGTGVFLWILRNFQEHFFNRTTPGELREKLRFSDDSGGIKVH